MKVHVLVIMLSFTLLLILYGKVYGQTQIEYRVQINSDGSAAWIIRTIGTEVSVNFSEFERRVTSLVETAKVETGRDMVAVRDSFSMTFNYSGSYCVVEYMFYWKNFSEVEGMKIIIGDVFQSENFFLQLYGDGEVYITYPSEYIIETVSPTPYERDDSRKTLRWLGTNDFTNELPVIILREKSVTPGFFETLQENAIVIAGLMTAAAGVSIGFYVFRRHRKKEKEIVKIPEIPTPLGIESAEDKILKLLKSSGGSLYQSAIADQCKFSKAKTSQLLAILENRGIVSRYKKGRDKIVTLVEQDKK